MSESSVFSQRVSFLIIASEMFIVVHISEVPSDIVTDLSGNLDNASMK